MNSFLKTNKTYLLMGFLFIIINSLLFFLTKPTVAMELLYYPWLVEKGLIMYIDFFHNHGPLLNYLLAPFTLDKSLISLKLFYIFVQNINLILVLILIKKFSKILGFIIGGIVFIILNFSFAYNYFWDEHIIATFFLLIFYMLNNKNFSLKPACIGILIGLLGLIKPNALIITIPILFFYKNKSFLFYPIFIWLISILYFSLNNAFLPLIDNYISWNFFYQNYTRSSYPYRATINSWSFLINFLITISIFAIYSINKKNINSKLIIFLLMSLVTVYPAVGDLRFVPFGAFLAIFISYVFTVTNKKIFFSVVLLLYLLGFSLHIKTKIINTMRLPSEIENSRTQKIISYLNTGNLYLKNFYIMSNNAEIYYFLDRPIKLYFPLMYPSISGYYKNYQQIYINNLRNNKTDLVVVPLPIDANYSSASMLMSYITTNYKLSHKDNDFLIYTKK